MNDARLTQQGKLRLPQLDGLRGLAVLMVVWWHYFNCQIGISASPPMWKLHMWQATSLFWSGVDLFFVLSGFLITGILLDHSKAKNLLPVFFARRALRILPLYVLILALAGLAFLALGERAEFHWLFYKLPPVSSFLTFTQNIVMGAQSDFGGRFLGMTWSLAVEEQFYLLWPLVILLCRGPRPLFIVSLVLAVGAPCLRLGSSQLVGMISMPHRLDSLLFGAMAALLVRHEAFVTAIRTKPRHLNLALLVLAPAVVFMTFFNWSFGVWNFFILGAFFTVILLHSVIHSGGRLARALSVPWLRRVGLLSYGLYMFHEPISGLLHGAVFHGPPSSDTWPRFVLTLFSLSLALLAAAVSMRFFESRFLVWGQRFQFGSVEPVPSPRPALAPAPACAPVG